MEAPKEIAMLLLALSSCGGITRASANSPRPTSRALIEQAVAVPSTNTKSRAQTSGAVQISDEIRHACGISEADAYFPFDSARLTSDDLTPLNQIASCFSSGPLRGRTLKLLGRADPRGEDEYNMVLGESRADAVEQYLGKKGLDKSKISASSRGAMDAHGTDEATWAKDRRVDLLLNP